MSSCASTGGQGDAGFEQVAGEVLQRASEPYIFGGETDERLMLRARESFERLGDRRFAALLAGREPGNRDAFRIVFPKSYLVDRKGVQTIAAIESGGRRVWPCEKMEREEWESAGQRYVDHAGW